MILNVKDIFRDIIDYPYPFNIENVLKDVLEYSAISLNSKINDILKHPYISLNISGVLEDTFTKY